MRKRRAAEFFAGIGLVRMALERSGWSVTFANDIDPTKFTMYRDYFGAEHFRLGDIRDVRAGDIPHIELATASFPCIDLSLAGNRHGLRGAHSSAYWIFHDIVEAMGLRRPEAVLIENVVGLMTSNAGRDLHSIIASLGKLGYFCDLLMVDAAHFVPQSRPRLFVVGTRRRSGATSEDPPPHQARPPQVERFIREHSDLLWRHVPLPPLPARRIDLHMFMERLRLDAPEWWGAQRQHHLMWQMSPRHRALLRHLVASKKQSFATVYKRVRPAGCRAEVRADGLAGCLRTPRGGSSKQFVIEAGGGGWRARNMTAREYARLQGVDDTFPINVPYTQALWGFGDAVCVPAVEWVVRHALEPRLMG